MNNFRLLFYIFGMVQGIQVAWREYLDESILYYQKEEYLYLYSCVKQDNEYKMNDKKIQYIK